MQIKLNKCNLKYVLEQLGYEVIPEFKFCPTRKWRADWKVSKDGREVLIEYEGIISEKARHTGIQGYSNDCEKYNKAQILGYTVLRYTALNINKIIKDLEEITK